jgi:quinol monooxygenase YgiN
MLNTGQEILREGFSIALLAPRLSAAAKAVFAVFAVIAGVSGARAQAQAQAPSGVFCVVAYIETATQSQKQAAALLKSWAATARKNPDNLGFAPLRRRDPANHFAIVEIWKDAKAFEAQSASPEGQQFKAAITAMLIAPYDERPHSVLAADLARLKLAVETAGRDAVFAVTHVDVIPPKKDDGIAATKGLFGPGSKSVGNLTFDVLQQNSRQNHMTLFEAWKTGADMAANAGQDYMKTYRFVLGPMSGALFDQRTYTILR